MNERVIERRRVLRLLCATGLVSVAASAESSTSHASSLMEGVDDATVHALAAEYRRPGGDEGGIAEVRSLLGDVRASEDRVVTRLRERMKEDFGQGRVVVLSGWVVSRTEGRIWVAASDLLGA
jgi:hypothetical protein